MSVLTTSPDFELTDIVYQAERSVKYTPNVFIVDDDVDIRMSLAAVLTAHGFVAKDFSSAEAFLEQYDPTQVGCLVIDLLLPGIGGRELAHQLRVTDSLLSMVIISGNIDFGTRWQLEGGPVALLEKPYEMSALLELVEVGVADSYRRRANRWTGGMRD